MDSSGSKCWRGAAEEKWSYETHLESMELGRLAARVQEMAGILSGDSFLAVSELSPGAASVCIGDSSAYFSAIELLRIALNYAELSGTLTVRCSLSPQPVSSMNGGEWHEMRMCLIWNQAGRLARDHEDAGCRACGACPASSVPKEAGEETGGEQPGPRIRTLTDGSAETGLRLSWLTRAGKAGISASVSSAMSRPGAVVVDDDASHLRYLEMVLSDGGFQVVTCLSEQQALAEVRDRPEAFQVALIHAAVNGFQPPPLIRTLRTESPTTRVVLFDRSGEITLRREYSAYPLLRAPIYPRELLDAAARAAMSARACGPRPRVLVADDEPAVRGFLRLALANEGFDVLEAAEGEEATRMLQCHAIDVVVLDLVMPGREGLETIRSIKKKLSTVSVVAISGLGGEALPIARHLGADFVLSKPIAIPTLLACVKGGVALKAERAGRQNRAMGIGAECERTWEAAK
jgi:DNA-binding response OmpR family regulator